ncbi:unnamed protein product [Litomosoides sigmodontis]|uniref:Peroxisome assembly protein 12 n=1 Tax=Litomosoides sigmodontis TaxID=42156 RepID=A0A3P6VCB8_LITSI|nr:unnamed protein product [Litomosoides sigmodontis]
MSENEKNEALVSGGLPSIFELIAQDSLSVSIQQAVQHTVKYLYECNPSRYGLLWKWYDEIYAVADLILESFYLKRYGGSLVENFYGMKRIINGTCRSASTGLPKLRSLFMLVGYMAIYHEKIRKCLFTALNIYDQEQFKANILTRCITFGLYFIQFLDFYYNSDIGENFRTEQRMRNWRYPAAPHKVLLKLYMKLRESSVLLLETNKCPLCLRRRTNDTALAVSGYVFCYGCIYSYVKEEKKCPVTGLQADMDDLIKILVAPV